MQKAEALPAPCHMACPAGIDIPSYLGLTAQGRYEEALEVIREDNPFAWVCGLICPHPCEKACVRAHLDQAVNIRYLKAFVARWAAEHAGYPSPVLPPPDGPRVAVVGSGPAGLSAAHYLALKGYRVTIFESLPVAGGLLMTGIPEYRLPRHIVRQEIQAVENLGVEIRTGVTVGKDVSFEELRARGYKAFFLGIGAHQGYRLEIAGEDDFPQVYDAISFLRAVNLGKREKPAENVVVIGGGNSAMDAARTCIRLGCKNVHIAYRRAREQMPASPHEVQEAMEEGVQFHFLVMPVQIGGENGQLSYLECLRTELGKPDASGRRRPVPVADSNFRIEVGAVIAAIGQQPDFRAFSYKIPFEITPRNNIVTEPFNTRTTVEDIFAGGDAVTGPATVVEAIAAGKQAALDIHHYLSRGEGPSPIFRSMRRRKVPFTPIPALEKISQKRIPVPLQDAEERKGNFDIVETGYDAEEAQREALRCLRCDMCIRCGACERVCRDAMQIHALDFKQISATERILNDYARPSEKCITCGACAIECPTGAIEYIEAPDHRELRLCGTVLNHMEAPKCQKCGEPFVPARYLQFVTSRSDAVTGKRVLRRLCPKCARTRRAENFVKL
ncbi:FAD-dependent oxidoreductase [Desulforhabdus sp. TSK]|uniref:FAD-dependent oxidoreductase n=1 Tax=Desulforhabdus sp. TSK TaxID=2925014 RepID=UPI001FC8D2D8|nr:FAD-dependent oxidoreductase [Desulforhabdus sp. TSK]